MATLPLAPANGCRQIGDKSTLPKGGKGAPTAVNARRLLDPTCGGGPRPGALKLRVFSLAMMLMNDIIALSFVRAL
jgi:hypothetical protein